MNQPLSKRVSLIELFYDLVFAYMISQATSLIHHIHHGIITPTTLGIFALVVIVFINSWMFQIVFTNRYGESSWTNVTFTFVDMAILLYMSNAFPDTFNKDLRTFFIAAGLLSLTLCLQYLIVYYHSTAFDRQIAWAFTLILAFRTITLLIGAWSLAKAVQSLLFSGSSLAGLRRLSPVSTPASGRLFSSTSWND